MVKSLTDPVKAGQLQNIKTVPRQPGSNPNLNTVVNFKVPLATDELYTPKLACMVYDQVFMGMSQPTVGTFTIPLGEIMREQRDERAQRLSRGQHYLDILTRKLRGDNVDHSIANLSQSIIQEAD